MPAEASSTISVRLDTSQAEKDALDLHKKTQQLFSRPLSQSSITRPLGAITSSTDEFSKSMAAANARVVAFGASAGVIFQVSEGIKELVSSTIEVNKTLTELNVLFNKNDEDLQAFGSSLFTVAKQTGQSFGEIAKGAQELARQGLGAEDTLGRLKDAAILARQSGLSLEESVLSLTAGINSFGKSALTSSEIINKLANVDASFAVSSKDLAEGLKRVGKTAEDAGVSIDELVGLITSAQQTTSRGGAVIGNALKTIFTRLDRPQVLQQLEEVGVAVKNLNGEVLPATQILKNFAGVFQTASPGQQAFLSEIVAGVYQINILKALLGDLSKSYGIADQATRKSAEAQDEAVKRNDNYNKSLSATLNKSKETLRQLGSQIGNLTIAPVIGRATSIVDTLFGDIDDQSKNIGAKLAEGMLSGLGNFLSGPGAIGVAAIVGKLLVNFAEFSRKAAVDFLGLNKFTKEQVALQETLQSVIAGEPQIRDLILHQSLSQLDIEKSLLAVTRLRIAEEEKLALITKEASTNILRTGQLGFNKKGFLSTPETAGAAQGLVPNQPLKPEISEVMGALAGGYEPGEVRRMSIPGLGGIVYNSKETIKDFGFEQPAILPPHNSKAGQNYKKEFKDTHGFDPYFESPDSDNKRFFAEGLTPKKKDTAITRDSVNSTLMINSLGKTYAYTDSDARDFNVDKAPKPPNKNKLLKLDDPGDIQSLYLNYPKSKEELANFADAAIAGDKKKQSRIIRTASKELKKALTKQGYEGIELPISNGNSSGKVFIDTRTAAAGYIPKPFGVIPKRNPFKEIGQGSTSKVFDVGQGLVAKQFSPDKDIIQMLGQKGAFEFFKDSVFGLDYLSKLTKNKQNLNFNVAGPILRKDIDPELLDMVDNSLGKQTIFQKLIKGSHPLERTATEYSESANLLLPKNNPYKIKEFADIRPANVIGNTIIDLATISHGFAEGSIPTNPYLGSNSLVPNYAYSTDLFNDHAGYSRTTQGISKLEGNFPVSSVDYIQQLLKSQPIDKLAGFLQKKNLGSKPNLILEPEFESIGQGQYKNSKGLYQNSNIFLNYSKLAPNIQGINDPSDIEKLKEISVVKGARTLTHEYAHFIDEKLGLTASTPAHIFENTRKQLGGKNFNEAVGISVAPRGTIQSDVYGRKIEQNESESLAEIFSNSFVSPDRKILSPRGTFGSSDVALKDLDLYKYLRGQGIVPYESEGLVPNYAKELGRGAYGRFYDLEKQFKGINVGVKYFRGHSSEVVKNFPGLSSEVEEEYTAAKYLEQVKNINPLFYFPKTIGSLERSTQPTRKFGVNYAGRIGKEVFPGITPSRVDNLYGEGGLYNLITPIQDLGAKQLKNEGVIANDFVGHMGNTLLNEKAFNIFDKIISKPEQSAKLAERLNKNEFLTERVSNALAKKGARFGVVDPGLFEIRNDNFADKGLIPNYADLSAFKKLIKSLNENDIDIYRDFPFAAASYENKAISVPNKKISKNLNQNIYGSPLMLLAHESGHVLGGDITRSKVVGQLKAERGANSFAYNFLQNAGATPETIEKYVEFAKTQYSTYSGDKQPFLSNKGLIPNYKKSYKPKNSTSASVDQLFNSKGLVPNYNSKIGEQRLNDIQDFLSDLNIKRPVKLNNSDYEDAISYLGYTSVEKLNKDLKDGYFGGAFPFGRTQTSGIAELLKKRDFKFNKDAGLIPNTEFASMGSIPTTEFLESAGFVPSPANIENPQSIPNFTSGHPISRREFDSVSKGLVPNYITGFPGSRRDIANDGVIPNFITGFPGSRRDIASAGSIPNFITGFPGSRRDIASEGIVPNYTSGHPISRREFDSISGGLVPNYARMVPKLDSLRVIDRNGFVRPEQTGGFALTAYVGGKYPEILSKTPSNLTELLSIMSERPEVLSDVIKKGLVKESISVPDISELQQISNKGTRRDLLKYADKNYYQIGEGSSRRVYGLSGSTVLKVATNDAGIAQNRHESSPELQQDYPDILNKVLHTGGSSRFLVSERASKINHTDFKDLTGLDFIDYSKITDKIDTGEKIPKELQGKINNPFLSRVLDFSKKTGTSLGDLNTINNLGATKRFGLGPNPSFPDSVPTILDAGLNDEIYNKYYSKGFTPNFALYSTLGNIPENILQKLTGLSGKTIPLQFTKHAQEEYLVDYKKYGQTSLGLPKKTITIDPSKIIELQVDDLSGNITKLVQQVDPEGTSFQDRSHIYVFNPQDSGVKTFYSRPKGTKQSLDQNRYKYANSGPQISAPDGFIPGFSALNEAISRENKAGIPKSLIKVGNSPILRSSANPMGLGVYNTKDEPMGLNQGIKRALSEGFDPKNYGYSKGLVPNYASDYARDTSSGPTITKTGLNKAFNSPESFEAEIQKEIREKLQALKQAIIAGTQSQDSLNKEAEATAKEYAFLPESIKRMNQSLSQTASYQTSQKELAEKAAQQAASEAAKDKNFYKQKYNNPNTPFNPPYLPNSLRAKPADASAQENLAPDRLTRKVQPTPQQKTKAQEDQEIYNSFASPTPGDRRAASKAYNDLVNDTLFGNGLSSSTEKQIRERNQKLAQQAESASSISSLFGFTKAGKDAKELSQSNPQAFQASRSVLNEKIGRASLGVSFGAPIVGGAVGSFFGDETKASRGGGALAQGLGNVASFASLGGSFGAAGLAVGGGIGLITELPNILNAFTSNLPDLVKGLEAANKQYESNSQNLQKYLNLEEQLKDVRSLSPQKITELKASQTESFEALPLERRQRITKALQEGGFEGAQKEIVRVNREDELQKRTTEFSTVFGKEGLFSSVGGNELFKTKKELKPLEKAVPFEVPDIIRQKAISNLQASTTSPNFSGEFGQAQGPLDRFASNRPEDQLFLSQSLQDLSSNFQKFLVSLPGKNDKNLFNQDSQTLNQLRENLTSNLGDTGNLTKVLSDFINKSSASDETKSSINKNISTFAQKNELPFTAIITDLIKNQLSPTAIKNKTDQETNLDKALINVIKNVSDFTSELFATIQALNNFTLTLNNANQASLQELNFKSKANSIKSEGFINTAENFAGPETIIKLKNQAEVQNSRQQRGIEQVALQQNFGSSINKVISSEVIDELQKKFQKAVGNGGAGGGSINPQKVISDATEFTSPIVDLNENIQKLISEGNLSGAESKIQDLINVLDKKNTEIIPALGAVGESKDKADVKETIEKIKEGISTARLQFRQESGNLQTKGSQEESLLAIQRNESINAFRTQKQINFAGGPETILSDPSSFARRISAGKTLQRTGGELGDKALVGLGQFEQAKSLKDLGVDIKGNLPNLFNDLVDNLAQTIDSSLSQAGSELTGGATSRDIAQKQIASTFKTESDSASLLKQSADVFQALNVNNSTFSEFLNQAKGDGFNVTVKNFSELTSKAEASKPLERYGLAGYAISDHSTSEERPAITDHSTGPNDLGLVQRFYPLPADTQKKNLQPPQFTQQILKPFADLTSAFDDISNSSIFDKSSSKLEKDTNVRAKLDNFKEDRSGSDFRNSVITGIQNSIRNNRDKTISPLAFQNVAGLSSRSSIQDRNKTNLDFAANITPDLSETQTRLLSIRSNIEEVDKIIVSLSKEEDRINKQVLNGELSILDAAKKKVAIREREVTLQTRIAFQEGKVSGRDLNEQLSREGDAKIKSGDFSLKDAGKIFSSELTSYNNQDYFSDIKKGAIDTADTMKSEFNNAFKEFATGSKSAGEAFKSFGLGILNKITDITGQIATNLLFSAVGNVGKGVAGLFSSGSSDVFTKSKGGVVGYSRGGKVKGGSGTTDDVPALLTEGEFIIKKSSVDKIGTDVLDKLNEGATAYGEGDKPVPISRRNRNGNQDVGAAAKTITKSGPNSFSTILKNSFALNDEKRPTGGYFNVDSQLSSLGQTDEDNPENRVKFQKEQDLVSYLQEKRGYDINKRNVLKSFKKSQQQALTAAYIQAGISVAAGAVKYQPSSSKQPNIHGIGDSNTNTPGNNNVFDNLGKVQQVNRGGPIKRYAYGGLAFGGDSSTDKIPALLTGGEYVVKKEVVDKYGIDLFNKINKGSISARQISKFADGGLVGPGGYQAASAKSDIRPNITSALSDIVQKFTEIGDSIKESLSTGGSKQPSQGAKTPSLGNNEVTNNINITVNVAKDGSVSARQDSSKNGKSNSSSDSEDSKKLAELIKQSTLKVIIEQKRNGGLLADNS